MIEYIANHIPLASLILAIITFATNTAISLTTLRLTLRKAKNEERKERETLEHKEGAYPPRKDKHRK